MRVQDGLQEGGDRDEAEVGKHQPRQVDRERDLPGRGGEPLGEETHDRRRKEDPEDRDGGDEKCQGRQDPGREEAGILDRAVFAPLRVGRDEDAGQRSLRHELPEEVGDAERRVEDVGGCVRPEEGGDGLVAGITGQPGRERQEGDDRCGADEPPPRLLRRQHRVGHFGESFIGSRHFKSRSGRRRASRARTSFVPTVRDILRST